LFRLSDVCHESLGEKIPQAGIRYPCQQKTNRVRDNWIQPPGGERQVVASIGSSRGTYLISMIFRFILLAILLAFFCNVIVIEAFTTPHITSSIHHTTSTSTQHNAGFMDDLSKFFGGLGGGNDGIDEQNDIAEVDGVYTGSKRIITVPSKSMKAGGLRLYCNLYLMGLQNTPEDGCWKASKADDSEVNLRYKDLSGSIIIRFADDGITVDRLGSAPSNKYLMHESVILNGFLDELKAIVFDGDISEANRLLTLVDDNDIEKNREAISFG